jgi:hypothetical protein
MASEPHAPVTESEGGRLNGAAAPGVPPEVGDAGLARARVREAAAEQQQSESSSAADRQEPPTEKEISAAVAELRNADVHTLRQVEPLAASLTRDRFEEVVETLRTRCLSSVVRNDAGLFVYLLRLECDQARREYAATVRAQAEAAPRALSRIERLKREKPEEYARRMAEWRERAGLEEPAA